jgi:hypothetical protein
MCASTIGMMPGVVVAAGVGETLGAIDAAVGVGDGACDTVGDGELVAVDPQAVSSSARTIARITPSPTLS